jgi:hypothetical protein
MARLACYAGDRDLTMHEMRKVFPALRSFGDPGTPNTALCDSISGPRPRPAPEDCDRCKAR